jgi:putative transposase
VIDPGALQIVLMVVTSWLDRREREAVAYFIEKNRLLRRQLDERRLRLVDDDRRRLAARACRFGRAALREIATIATSDTLLRWHRHLIARKWTYVKRSGRRGVLLKIHQLVVRMPTDNPTWGYTRIQAHSRTSAIAWVARRFAASSKRRVPPVPQRPTSWQTLLNAHWGAIATADFFTIEVWTWRGLVAFYPVFVIDLASRRVQILGSTRIPRWCSCSKLCGLWRWSRPRGPTGR